MRAAALSVGSFFSLLLVCFVFLGEGRTQPRPEVPPLDVTESQRSRIEQSQQALLDFRLNEAEDLLRPFLAVDSGLPYPYYLYSSVAFWRAMVEDVDSAYDTFFERSDSLFHRLDGVEESRWARFLRAEAYLQRVIVLGKTEQVLRAAWTGRKVYHAYTNLIQEYPDFYAAYLGKGLTDVLLGSLPDTYRWILARVGIQGTVDEGIRRLEIAAEKSPVNAPQAEATLAVIDIILNQDPEKGTRRLEGLYEKYPESLMFAHLYGYSLLSSRRAEDAEEVFRRAFERRKNPAYHYIDFITFYRAEAHFVQNQFSAAERFYRDFLQHYSGKALVAMARLQCGLALEMQGDYEAALEFYRAVSTERTFDSDEYARQRARERREQPMTPTERKLLRGSNYYEAGAYDAAEDVLLPLYETSDLSVEQRAEAAYYLGRVRHAQNQLDEALEFYGHAATEPGDETARWKPWSQFYIGQIYARRGEPGKARALFEQVLSYDHDYSYKKGLEQRTYTALDQL